VIVFDTGPLVAAALSNDTDHKACVELFTALHAARRELLVPATVVAEVGYLLAREAGARVESLFLRSWLMATLRPSTYPTLTTRGWLTW
jgi:predicted nucleic acid-binding protein